MIARIWHGAVPVSKGNEYLGPESLRGRQGIRPRPPAEERSLFQVTPSTPGWSSARCRRLHSFGTRGTEDP
jgi:hypothetical protein